MAVKKVTSNKRQVTRNVKTVQSEVKVAGKGSSKSRKTAKKDVVESSVTVKKVATGPVVDVVDLSGKVVKKITLPAALFGIKVNKALLAQYVRVYLANQRSGSASTKTRGEVTGSTRKIYRQKGTGRARHGGIRAPIFVHGGVAFGPKPRDYSLSLPQKMRQRALASAFSGKLADGEIHVVAGTLSVAPKTKEMVKVIHQFDGKKKQQNILFLLPTTDKTAENVVKAVRNIAGVSYMPAQVVNAYAVLRSNHVLIAKEALSVLEKTFVK